jgi:uncharacterized cysteine cluster protein YcgN (CxxCxxCC family)
MDIASIIYHSRGRLRLGVKSRYQKRAAISGRRRKHPEVFCERCGKCARCQLHHRDYNRPELTMWLCDACHKHQHSRDRYEGLDCSLSGRWKAKW